EVEAERGERRLAARLRRARRAASGLAIVEVDAVEQLREVEHDRVLAGDVVRQLDERPVRRAATAGFRDRAFAARAAEVNPEAVIFSRDAGAEEAVAAGPVPMHRRV